VREGVVTLLVILSPHRGAGGVLGWGGSYEDREHHCYWVLTSNEGIVRMTIKGDSCQATLQPATLGDGAHRRGLSLLRDSKHGLLWATTMDNLYAYRVEADASLHPFPLHDIAGEDKKVLDQLLIAQPDATITDVATKVGFATPKYFPRLFRDKFGVSPKEYTAENPLANLSADNEN